MARTAKSHSADRNVEGIAFLVYCQAGVRGEEHEDENMVESSNRVRF